MCTLLGTASVRVPYWAQLVSVYLAGRLDEGLVSRTLPCLAGLPCHVSLLHFGLRSLGWKYSQQVIEHQRCLPFDVVTGHFIHVSILNIQLSTPVYECVHGGVSVCLCE